MTTATRQIRANSMAPPTDPPIIATMDVDDVGKVEQLELPGLMYVHSSLHPPLLIAQLLITVQVGPEVMNPLLQEQLEVLGPKNVHVCEQPPLLFSQLLMTEHDDPDILYPELQEQ